MSDDQTLTVDGVEHNINDFSEVQKYYFAQIQDLMKRGGALKFQIDQIDVAREIFTDKLISSLKPEEEAQAEDA